ncbi:NAD(P)-dependent oxidoreductase [Fulvivirga ligni]|uniref:NAD(P)-dependent oxidoreductase n=1 Tax=Fulvivirga ligni TaxID=2904246 RepID=UPI001F3A62BE|nr:NAD(P)-dependent oxidoreductase [Fulvivirga ligni]UII21087.1 NAD(P)-binding domain-containing protein [Fulvivirga ligni]
MKCLIVDYMHESIEQDLREIGVQPDYQPTITREEILSVISEYEGLIVRSKVKVDEELVAGADKLLFIGRAGAGIDNLDEKVLAEKNIAIFNAPEGNRNAVGEQCLGMLLSLMNNVVKADKEVRAFEWDREGNRGEELEGKTVAIIGYGFMGQSFAKKLKGLGVNILAYDKYKSDYGDEQVKQATMEEVYSEADVLSLHIPLTEETRSMVDYDYINQFAKKIYFINSSRGEVVPLDGVCQHMQEGKIKAAALDVLENEKLKTLTELQRKSFEYLSKSDKTILTPHIAGWSFESYERINKVLVSKIKDFLNEIQ